MSAGLNIQREEKGKVALLRLQGRLDATSTPHLEKHITELLAEKFSHIVLDFSKIEYLSSAGIRLLLATTKKLKALSGKCVLFALRDEVLEIIQMAGFEKILNLFATEEQALSSLA